MVAAILVLALQLQPAPPQDRAKAIQTMNDAVDLVAKGDLRNGEAKLKDAAEADPSYGLVHYNLGLVQLRNHALADAKASFVVALEHSTGAEAVEMRYRVGATVLLMSEAAESRVDRRALTAEALEHLEAVTKTEPKRAQAQLRVAWCHERLDRPAQADVAYRRAIDADKRLSAAYVGLGLMYVDYGHHNVGIAVLDTNTTINPTSADAWLGLGNGQMAIDEPARAVDAYRKAKTVDPDLGEAYFRLGLAQAELRQRKESIESLEEFLRRAGDDVPDVWKVSANHTIARMQDVI
jgi:tetratricopeptide (TPR) repeat protein